MKIAIYPGSFDPFTNGHFDILQRASKLFDKVIIAIGNNPNKNVRFSLEERLQMLDHVAKKFSNVEVASFSTLTAQFALQCGAQTIIRGLRALNDFEYEFQMALTNEQLFPDIEMVYLMARKENTFISSSLVMELATFKQDISMFVPAEVDQIIQRKLQKK